MNRCVVLVAVWILVLVPGAGRSVAAPVEVGRTETCRFLLEQKVIRTAGDCKIVHLWMRYARPVKYAFGRVKSVRITKRYCCRAKTHQTLKSELYSPRGRRLFTLKRTGPAKTCLEYSMAHKIMNLVCAPDFGQKPVVARAPPGPAGPAAPAAPAAPSGQPATPSGPPAPPASTPRPTPTPSPTPPAPPPPDKKPPSTPSAPAPRQVTAPAVKPVPQPPPTSGRTVPPPSAPTGPTAPPTQGEKKVKICSTVKSCRKYRYTRQECRLVPKVSVSLKCSLRKSISYKNYCKTVQKCFSVPGHSHIKKCHNQNVCVKRPYVNWLKVCKPVPVTTLVKKCHPKVYYQTQCHPIKKCHWKTVVRKHRCEQAGCVKAQEISAVDKYPSPDGTTCKPGYTLGTVGPFKGWCVYCGRGGHFRLYYTNWGCVRDCTDKFATSHFKKIDGYECCCPGKPPARGACENAGCVRAKSIATVDRYPSPDGTTCKPGYTLGTAGPMKGWCMYCGRGGHWKLHYTNWSCVRDCTDKFGSYSFKKINEYECCCPGKPPAQTGPSLKTDKKNYRPGERITVTFTAPDKYPKDAWVGIIPAKISHGSEAVNDQHDVAYQYLNKKTAGMMYFKAPDKPGSWTVRMHDTDHKGREVASVEFTVGEAGPTLKIDKRGYRPGERIKVTFTAPAKYPQDAWIGIIPGNIAHGSEATNDQHDVAHQYLNKKTSGVMYFKAPDKPGSWTVRMHDTDKNGREVASVTFQVRGEKPTLRLDQKTYRPGERIAVTFTAPDKYPQDAWVGIIPAKISHGSEAVNDQHDVAHQYLNKKTSGVMYFKAPDKPGSWTVRMHDTDHKGREVASVEFTVGESGPTLKIDKRGYKPGERIKVTFTAPDTYPQDAWIGIIPGNITHGSETTNDQHDVAHQYLNKKTSGVMYFKAPDKPGSWTVRMHDKDQNGREVASVEFTVGVQEEKVSLRLDKKTYRPGERITVNFTAPASYHHMAWIGIVPANIPHGSEKVNDLHDVAFIRYGGKTSGVLHFTAPKKPGAWTMRMHDSDMNGREVASVEFTVR
jgi:hypothetical protein